jgi:hypothetical protein
MRLRLRNAILIQASLSLVERLPGEIFLGLFFAPHLLKESEFELFLFTLCCVPFSCVPNSLETTCERLVCEEARRWE